MLQRRLVMITSQTRFKKQRLQLLFNILKPDFMVIGSQQGIASLAGNISLSVNGLTLQQVETTKCLGLTID